MKANITALIDNSEPYRKKSFTCQVNFSLLLCSMEFKKVFLAIKIVAVLYVLLLIIVYGGQRFIIFHPDRMAKEEPFTFDASFKEHFLETAPGIQINYLHFKPTTSSKGLILYFHGNADNLKRWGSYHTAFTDRGYDVIMPDYRGYGKSDGQVSEEETYQDMRILYKHVYKRLQPKELIVYGRSLGSGVATTLAKEAPVKYLILETPFYSIPSVFSDQLQSIWLPFSFRYRFPNFENITQVKCPIVIFHGTKDRVVPYRNAIKLEPILKKEDTFVAITDGTHHNLSTYEVYQHKMNELLGFTNTSNERKK
ncbi:MAG: alpha-beta hydrolase superfamily lysophospholipase [Polaribacter sp.]|jgi:alpha-beta hydrolase superfamily lysophospholipase